MTKKEMLALITGKIAGQGTNVDGGGELAEVLTAIVAALPAEEQELLSIPYGVEMDSIGKSEAIELLGLTSEQFDSLPEQKYIKTNTQTLTRLIVNKTASGFSCIFGVLSDGSFVSTEISFYYDYERDSFHMIFREI